MSRAGQFNESKAHQRRAGRAGGFGGPKGGVPPAAESFISIETNQTYNWDTGEAQGGVVRVHKFGPDMANLGAFNIEIFGESGFNFAPMRGGGGGGGAIYLGGVRTFIEDGNPTPYHGVYDAVSGIFYKILESRGRFQDGDTQIGGPVGGGNDVLVSFAAQGDAGSEIVWGAKVGLCRLRAGECRFRDFRLVNGGSPHLVCPLVADADENNISYGRSEREEDNPAHSDHILRFQRGPYRTVEDLPSNTEQGLPELSAFAQLQASEYDGFEAFDNAETFEDGLYQLHFGIGRIGGGLNYSYHPCLFRKAGHFPEYRHAMAQVLRVPYEGHPIGVRVVAFGFCDTGTINSLEQYTGVCGGK